MKALKTIVATAVIVFALTTVAMAGVQHLTKQGGQAVGSRAQAAQSTSTITLTAAQLAQLMNGGRAAVSGGVHHARQTRRHAPRTQHHAKAARHDTSSHHAGDTIHAAASGQGGTPHYETVHHAGSSGSGSHHAGEGGHGGGDCGD